MTKINKKIYIKPTNVCNNTQKYIKMCEIIPKFAKNF